MKHDRARNDENWWLTDKVPAAGKEVKFSFHRTKPALLIEREKRLAEEDKKAAEEEASKPKTETGDEAKDGGKL
jgi:hypothetical protein